MIVDANGKRFVPKNDGSAEYMEGYFEVAYADMMREMAEQMYGQDADTKVHELRRSVLGDAVGPGPNPILGLSASLP